MLLSTDRRGALDRLARDYEQHRRALAWFLGRDNVDRAARMVRALRESWWERGDLTEGRTWAAWALAVRLADAPGVV